MKILLIQGNGAIRRRLRDALTSHGISVTVASAIGEASARARLAPFTLIVNTNLQRGNDWWEDHALIAERRGLVLRNPGKYELYRTLPEVRALGVLVAPGDRADALQDAITTALKSLAATAA